VLEHVNGAGFAQKGKLRSVLKRKVGWRINMLPYQEGGGVGCLGDPAELCMSDVWDRGDGA